MQTPSAQQLLQQSEELEHPPPSETQAIVVVVVLVVVVVVVVGHPDGQFELTSQDLMQPISRPIHCLAHTSSEQESRQVCRNTSHWDAHNAQLAPSQHCPVSHVFAPLSQRVPSG